MNKKLFTSFLSFLLSFLLIFNLTLTTTHSLNINQIMMGGVFKQLIYWGGKNWLDGFGGSMTAYIQYQGENDAQGLQDWLSETLPGWESMSEEEFTEAGYDITLFNIGSYNVGDYTEKEQITKDVYTPSINVNEIFSFWRPLSGQLPALYVDSDYSRQWQNFIESYPDDYVFCQAQLVSPDSLDVLYDIRGTDYKGIGHYNYSYFASSIFTFDENSSVQFSSIANQEPAQGVFNGRNFIRWEFQLMEYSGEDYVENDSFLNPYDNYKWIELSPWYNGTKIYDFEPDKKYMLVARCHTYPLVNDFESTIQEYAYYKSNLKNTFTLKSGNIQNPNINNNSGNVFNYFMNDYRNEYYTNNGNWWQGDNNGDGDVDIGGGGGSGDGSLDGSLDLNIDGSLDLEHGGSVDHNHNGDIDINVNIGGLWPSGTPPPEGEEPDSSGLFQLFVDFFTNIFSWIFNLITDVITAIVSPFIAIFNAFIESCIGAFNSLLNAEFAMLIQSIFFFLPAEIAQLITVGFYALFIFGIIKFFI